MSRMETQLGADPEFVYEEGQSSESVTNTSYPRPSTDTDDCSDTSLRLGLPLFSSK
ncbi:MADS-transcription factor 68 [Zea mays]|nr:MADS-transcription factor 68 [Zea mays]